MHAVVLSAKISTRSDGRKERTRQMHTTPRKRNAILRKRRRAGSPKKCGFDENLTTLVQILTKVGNVKWVKARTTYSSSLIEDPAAGILSKMTCEDHGRNSGMLYATMLAKCHLSFRLGRRWRFFLNTVNKMFCECSDNCLLVAAIFLIPFFTFFHFVCSKFAGSNQEKVWKNSLFFFPQLLQNVSPCKFEMHYKSCVRTWSLI